MGGECVCVCVYVCVRVCVVWGGVPPGYRFRERTISLDFFFRFDPSLALS